MTNLKDAIQTANDLQCWFIETGVKNGTLQQIIDNMVAHEAEHEWIFSRLNRLVEIYNIVGADGSQCADRVKELKKSDDVFRKVIAKLIAYNHGMVPNWLLDFEKL